MSSFVTAAVRSVGGKITRSGLDTRRSRPPASRIVSGTGAMNQVLPTRAPALAPDRSAPPADVVDPDGADPPRLDLAHLVILGRVCELREEIRAAVAGHALEALV